MMQQFIVVDDSRAIQSIICRAIAGGGYGKDSIHAVSSGVEALALLGTLRPDLIITDWHMPGISGLDLVKTLRQSGHKDIKVGMVTTELSEVRMAEARQNGVEFILHKPFKDGELLAAIEKSVGSPSLCRETHPAGIDPGGREGIAGVDAVIGVLNAIMPAAPFSVVKAATFELDPPPRKVLVGLYSEHEAKTVAALCIMDMACAALIAAAKLGQNLAQMQSVLSTDPGLDVIAPPASGFLRNVTALFPAYDKKPYTLSRWNVLSVDVAPLKKALQRNAGMQAYELQLRGFGQGRLVLVRFAEPASGESVRPEALSSVKDGQ